MPIKIIEFNQARSLRQSGKSIKDISKILKISSSTASKWCKNVVLTDKQKEALNRHAHILRVKHLKNLAKQKNIETIKKKHQIINTATSQIANISNNELFLIGLALYWAEGFKSSKEARVGFCNSDPKMIIFILKWLEKCFNIKKQDLTVRAEFNISHLDRTDEILNFWSKITKIPLSQFEKPFYHKSTWLKSYDNPEKYFGVLRIRVRRSSILLLQIKGYLQGLKQAKLLKKQSYPA